MLRLLSWSVASILLFFTARRWLFMLTALLPDRANRIKADDATLPSVLILIPARNEFDTLPELLAALDFLDYPAACLTGVLIDDGSTDDTSKLMTQWVTSRPSWHILTLTQNEGKASALNQGLRAFSQGDIIIIYDADERPRPDSLRHLITPFTDLQVGAVSGRRAVSNALDSPTTSYTAFEGLVHQLITMRAKDRLQLAPAVLGANCAYRRTALEATGAFRPGALLEDSDLSIKLPQSGWQIRYEPQAISEHQVPRTVYGYWQQHTRWARGFNDVARDHISQIAFNASLPLLLRLELMAFMVGYLDRLALGLAGFLWLFKLWSRFPSWVLSVTLLTPFLQTIVALKLAQAPRLLWRRLIWLPIFFGVDLAMAANGFLGAIKQAPQHWEERRRRQ